MTASRENHSGFFKDVAPGRSSMLLAALNGLHSLFSKEKEKESGGRGIVQVGGGRSKNKEE